MLKALGLFACFSMMKVEVVVVHFQDVSKVQETNYSVLLMGKIEQILSS